MLEKYDPNNDECKVAATSCCCNGLGEPVDVPAPSCACAAGEDIVSADDVC